MRLLLIEDDLMIASFVTVDRRRKPRPWHATTTEECERLLEIINTTLDIAEAESGAAKLKLTDIDLVDLVGDALELFQAIAEDQQITITADLPDECRIHGDRQRLQRVVANLLDSGLKYMPAGGHVTIKLIAEGERVTLSIEDTGIGISPDESARIFERFYRCDSEPLEAGERVGSKPGAGVRVGGATAATSPSKAPRDKAARSPLCFLGPSRPHRALRRRGRDLKRPPARPGKPHSSSVLGLPEGPTGPERRSDEVKLEALPFLDCEHQIDLLADCWAGA